MYASTHERRAPKPRHPQIIPGIKGLGEAPDRGTARAEAGRI
jgi:hypothetical protein